MSAPVLERREASRPAPVGPRRPVASAPRSRRGGRRRSCWRAGAWYGHHWWTVGRFLESTDDAYRRRRQ